MLDFSGDTAGALDHSGQALKIYKILPANSSNPKFRKELVVQTYHYANLLKTAGRLDEAKPNTGKPWNLASK